MEKEAVISSKAPQPIGPYSQAIKINGMIFTSGQIPIDLETGAIVEGGVAGQTQAVLQYIQAILKQEGSSLEKVVKTTVFLKDMNDFAEMNNIYAQYFQGETPPARSTIEVSRLPKDVLVEIEAIAAI